MARREHGSETAIQKLKREKRICIETLKKNNLLLMTVSVQEYTKIEKELIKANSKGSLNSF
jgi:CxxC motif-containing protein